MNSSPESLFKDLLAEQTLADSSVQPDQAELFADWQLRRELGQLGAQTLPVRLRATVLAQTSRRRHPIWSVGLAAAIVLALGVGLFHQTSEPTNDSLAISDSDLHQLQLALATLDQSARHTGQLATRQLAANLRPPDFSLDQLPYGRTLLLWTQPPKPET
jgi:hypothetical protein